MFGVVVGADVTCTAVNSLARFTFHSSLFQRLRQRSNARDSKPFYCSLSKVLFSRFLLLPSCFKVFQPSEVVMQVFSDNATRIVFLDGQPDLMTESPLPLAEEESLPRSFATSSDVALQQIQQVSTHCLLLSPQTNNVHCCHDETYR